MSRPLPPTSRGAALAALRVLLLAIALVVCGAAVAGDLRAAVWEHRDDGTGLLGAEVLLASAAFDVISLPRDRSPAELDVDLIVLGSFVSEAPGYGRYMRRYGAGLRDFVAAGGVLLQLTQDDAVEPSPAFLPAGLAATRGGQDFRYLVADDLVSPLLVGLAGATSKRPLWPIPDPPRGAASWNAFREHEGFHVLLWSDPQVPCRDAALLEGAHGAGRVLLASLYLDKLYDRSGRSEASGSYQAAASRFFRNLRDYVEGVPDAAPVAPRCPDPPPVLPRVEGSWTLVVLPDTQYYARGHPDILDAQVRWIVDNRDARAIAYVIHEGDVVHADEKRQWRTARRALDRLRDSVPLALTTGNHDYDWSAGLAKRRTGLHDAFPAGEPGGEPGLGGLFEPGRPENAFHLFTAGGRRWIVVTLEFFPRDAAVTWAREVLARHPDRTAIVVTHAYLSEFDTRIDRRGAARDDPSREGTFPRGLNDGEDLWRKLVSPSQNVAFVLSGHVTGFGVGLLTSTGEHGQRVHQILANYQMRVSGGEGYLRLMEFLPGGRRVQIRTYSPWLDAYMTWPEQQMVLDLPPPAPRTSAEP